VHYFFDKKHFSLHVVGNQMISELKKFAFVLPVAVAGISLKRGRAFGKKILFLWPVLIYSRLYII
jgi:hypothetical protein